MTKKRYKKSLMCYGASPRTADKICEHDRKIYKSYEKAASKSPLLMNLRFNFLLNKIFGKRRMNNEI